MRWSWRPKPDEGEQWIGSQLQLLESGVEIEPPWVMYPGQEPWMGFWRQGRGEWWAHHIWRPFWSRLTRRERAQYLDRWDGPSDWREHVLLRWYSTDCVTIPFPDAVSPESSAQRGMTVAVFGISSDPPATRWYVSIGADGFGAEREHILIRDADLDRFSAQLHACAATFRGRALLQSCGEDEFALRINVTDPFGGCRVRYRLAHRQSGPGRWPSRALALSGEVHLDKGNAATVIAQFIQLRNDLCANG